MMRLSRLRRSVALFICPEMGVEARLKAARAAGEFPARTDEPYLAFSVAGPLSGAAMITVLARLNGAADPWAEYGLWLQERRSLNRSLGGNDEVLLGLLACHVGTLRFPVMSGGRQ